MVVTSRRIQYRLQEMEIRGLHNVVGFPLFISFVLIWFDRGGKIILTRAMTRVVGGKGSCKSQHHSGAKKHKTWSLDCTFFLLSIDFLRFWLYSMALHKCDLLMPFVLFASFRYELLHSRLESSRDGRAGHS